MAKIVIAGKAVVITSDIKLEDLRTIAKYRPDALVLKGGEDGKEPIFAVSVAQSGNGDINQYGASFAGETHDEEKLATVTMVLTDIETDPRDIREIVADRFGGAIVNLNRLEATLPDVLREIGNERQSIMNNISVVG